MTFKKVTFVCLLCSTELFFWGCAGYRHTNDLGTTMAQAKDPARLLMNREQISEFDPIIRYHSRREELDWRFISAICYHESRFQNNLTSRSGAVGIMQVMPSVARQFGISADSITDPEVNVATAIKILKSIESTMSFPEKMSQEDRMKITLACYNAGVGHVMDACRLAAKNGANHRRWDELEPYLRLKGTPQYADDAAVRFGKFYGGQTIKFVKVVMSQYDKYCEKFPS